MFSLIEINREIWNEHWTRVSHAPLLQSWEYGEAKCKAQRFRVQRFLLQNEKGEAVGLLQALVYSLPLIGGVARINRGPVFFSNSMRISPSPEEVKEIMAAVRETAKRKRWRLLWIIPEFLSDDGLTPLLGELGFKKRATPPVASATIDMARTAEEIRASFHRKWRNLLNKSEKMGLELEVPPAEEALPFLIHGYEEFQQQKDFKGVSTKLLQGLVKQEGPTWNCQTMFARHEGERHCALMVVGHGDTCTPLANWTSLKGRDLQAYYFLLWQSILLFREIGYSFYDVGGLGSQTTGGVEHFKKRLQGQEYSLIGEYSYSTLPFLK